MSSINILNIWQLIKRTAHISIVADVSVQNNTNICCGEAQVIFGLIILHCRWKTEVKCDPSYILSSAYIISNEHASQSFHKWIMSKPLFPTAEHTMLVICHFLICIPPPNWVRVNNCLDLTIPFYIWGLLAGYKYVMNLLYYHWLFFCRGKLEVV